ncbi:hypothetical protein [Nonomuraea sp. NEAU-A123]|uniref:hypothetical protein n=1 Tax=Nonomuraea sp. NEAU-A123 TaxID=2839649 RepID=UPI001BE3D882|nr:hypothetical protein [Nonomuraea sp. NEAU-A123]MBT2227758.1 hypothetical protein [Nonomuraea sp. NEAU-A123]
MAMATIDGKTEPETTPPRQRRRRGRGKVVAGLLIAVAAAGGGFVAVNSTGLLEGGAGPTQPAAALPPATTTVTRQTLNDTRDADGELGYGPVTSSRSAGRATSPSRRGCSPGDGSRSRGAGSPRA